MGVVLFTLKADFSGTTARYTCQVRTESEHNNGPVQKRDGQISQKNPGTGTRDRTDKVFPVKKSAKKRVIARTGSISLVAVITSCEYVLMVFIKIRL